MSNDRPKGDLGPKYTEPGQKVYEDTKTRGGWYTAGIPALRERLIEAGLLPSTQPAGARPIDEVALLSTEKLVALAGAMGLVVAGTAVFLRRRTLTAT